MGKLGRVSFAGLGEFQRAFFEKGKLTLVFLIELLSEGSEPLRNKLLNAAQ